MKTEGFENIDSYIATHPAEVRELLEKMRATIQKASPQATEKISYQMPTFFLNGNLVHFAAFKSHIGFYPGPGGIEAFRHKMNDFEVSKGAVRFPFAKPLPLALVSEIVAYRTAQNSALPTKKAKKKP